MKGVPRAHPLNWFPFRHCAHLLYSISHFFLCVNNVLLVLCEIWERGYEFERKSWINKKIKHTSLNYGISIHSDFYLAFIALHISLFFFFVYEIERVDCSDLQWLVRFIVGGIVDVQETFFEWLEASSSRAFIACTKIVNNYPILVRCARSVSYPHLKV